MICATWAASETPLADPGAPPPQLVGNRLGQRNTMVVGAPADSKPTVRALRTQTRNESPKWVSRANRPKSYEKAAAHTTTSWNSTQHAVEPAHRYAW